MTMPMVIIILFVTLGLSFLWSVRETKEDRDHLIRRNEWEAEELELEQYQDELKARMASFHKFKRQLKMVNK